MGSFKKSLVSKPSQGTVHRAGEVTGLHGSQLSCGEGAAKALCQFRGCAEKKHMDCTPNNVHNKVYSKVDYYKMILT